ncbi:SDR family NAD(P)-dependent oxidoreductase [Microbacterium radiodurans]|uniref:SDR family NAD(P)-dependent oxidoreductase n=1 Tax=Microbacterium radiodurans TaxID=661398 RepID=A0A5J5IXG8_9MICO|nr:SDR family NAD(P)-dependent oxidoreductase [Microbacterium radiodurans]KAA9089492.1 SDR family NAD(P)-dependent oxidoreductase [Microbacterium radiodurans]
MARDDWDPRKLPDLSGKRYLVTGSNAGLGYFSSLQLASAGAHVIMTGRSPQRLATARASVLRALPEGVGSVETLLLDTSNLGSVRAAAATARGRKPLHGLLLNAGVVHPPRRRKTTYDGHELVFATNVLGHFALAGELLIALAAGRGRMVWLGSVSTSIWKYDPADIELEREYSPWRAYVQSKVATTALGLEADRRLAGGGVPVDSLVAHPGYSTSGRTRGIAGINEPSRRTRFADGLQAAVTQSKEQGAWPLVRALVDPDAVGGEFYGPSGVLRGAPVRATPAAITRDADVAERVWTHCEQATRAPWPYLKASRTRAKG